MNNKEIAERIFINSINYKSLKHNITPNQFFRRVHNLGTAFIWLRTPEGCDFWFKLVRFNNSLQLYNRDKFKEFLNKYYFLLIDSPFIDLSIIYEKSKDRCREEEQ